MKGIFGENGKVIEFRQDHGFLFDRAMKHLDRDDIERAAELAAKACALDPKNTEYRLELAGIYAEMCRYDESNGLLVDLLTDGYEDEAELWYGIGCNFTEMQYYNYAETALDRVIEMDGEDTERSLDADEILEPIEEYSKGDEKDRTTWFLHHRILDAEGLYFDGELEQAEGILSRVDAVDPLFMNARNTLARIRYELGEKKEAMELSRSVLSKSPNDIGAMSNIALFSRDMGDKKTCDEMLDGMEQMRFDREIQDLDDLYNVARTLLECERYDAARKKAELLLSMTPGERGAMHMTAVCRYRMGDYAGAAAIWQRMLKIDRADSTSEYFMRHSLRVARGDSIAKRDIPADPILPDAEFRRRSARIKKYMEDIDRAKAKWQTHPEFRSLILWGIEQPELKLPLIVFLGVVGGELAEKRLRRELLRPPYSDDTIRCASGALVMMGAKLPYHALMIDSIGKLEVSGEKPKKVELFEKKFEQYAYVLELVLIRLNELYDDRDVHRAAASMWSDYTDQAQEEGLPAIRKPEAFAAALEYIFRRSRGEDRLTKTEVMRLYGASLSAFNHALAKLAQTLGKRKRQ